MNLSREELLSQLRQMDEYEFEELVADVWELRGWQTTVTTDSNDRGIDVIAEKSSPFYQKQLIQAKRYSKENKIGSPDIQQYSSLREQEDDTDAVVIVTTSSFSRQAKQTARDLNVKLIDGNSFYNMLSGEEHLIREYVNYHSTSDNSEEETQNTDDVFEDLYMDLIQGIVSENISPDDIKKTKRELCREQSLPQIPSNLEVLTFATSITDSEIPDYVFDKSLIGGHELAKYIEQLDLERHPEINISESGYSGSETKTGHSIQKDPNNSTNKAETTSGNDDDQRDYSSYRRTSRKNYISKQSGEKSPSKTKEFKRACKEISEVIIDENPSSDEVEEIKRRICDKHSSPKVPSNTELAQNTSGPLAIKIGTYVGAKEFTAMCPICESSSALWKNSHPEMCESCGTEWVKKSKFLRKTRWKSEGGPGEENAKTAKQWRREVSD